MTKIDLTIPEQVSRVTKQLQVSGYEAYLVGGCVRDLLLNREPNDWDVTTNATPEQIQSVFEHTFYENDFGTVGVVNDDIAAELETDVSCETRKKLETIKVIEVTPYRTESAYSDSRRPDQVLFSEKLEDDLMRRDFTINAMCYNPQTQELVDMYGGVQDLQNKIIQTVGDPIERMQEDALRLMRAVRFATQLEFSVSHETSQVISDLSENLGKISNERIRDEFNKIIMSDSPKDGIELLREHNLLQFISPLLVDTVGCEQNGAHIYDVYEHLVRTLQHAADKKWPLEIRLAALFHDISKPSTRRFDKNKNDYTFYGHEVVGSRETRKILEKLKYPKDIVSHVTLLVRWHMFFSDPDEITLTAVRRIIRNVGGSESVWDLIRLRICDRIGMGRPKERSYRLRQYEVMMEEAMRSPISVKDLKISGDDLIEQFHMKPGKRIGWILHACMRETLHTPDNNNHEWLVKHVTRLQEMSDEELQNLYLQGKEAIDDAEEAELKEIRKKYKVGKRNNS